MQSQIAFPFVAEAPKKSRSVQFKSIEEDIAAFREFGQATRRIVTEAVSFEGETLGVPTYVNEYWTAKQRQAHSLQEISYRACFKPQLPRFFIERLTQAGEVVYDPFMGRGTTLMEAALLGRVPCGCDMNPLSAVLTKPRLAPPSVEEIAKRLEEIDFSDAGEMPEELLVFYHPETLRQISALKKYLMGRSERASDARESGRSRENGPLTPALSPSAGERENRGLSSGWHATARESLKTNAISDKGSGKVLDEAHIRGALDAVDDWIRMVALNRLTGHSGGFFSVYTLPPNQAVSVKSQRKINEKRKQTPPHRDVAKLILKKSRQLHRDCEDETLRTLAQAGAKAAILTGASNHTPEIKSDSVSLVVTSPPFLDVVQYADDNWLRCWFIGIDAKSVKLTVPKKLEAWQVAMTEVFRELHRVVKPGGHVAFEVGEVHGGKTKLEEAVVPCGMAAGLTPVLVLINDQKFTKTANCWGVDNQVKGTNTNRVVLFRKGGAG